MGKFERKINKELNKDIESFDEWFDNNRTKLGKFEKKHSTEQVIPQRNLLVKAKSLWIYGAIFCTVLIVGMLLIFNFALNKTNNDITFSDDSVRYEKMEIDEQNKLIQQHSFLNNLLIEDGVNILHKNDNSLVAIGVNGDLETEDNYYLCRVMFEYNKNFHFSSKGIYDNLNGRLQTDKYNISYSTKGTPFDGWYKNYILLETKQNQKIYIELECMEDDLTGFIKTLTV